MDLAIVILNWNGKEYLERFLPGVIQHSVEARIVVADNGSSDDSLAFLSQLYPSVEQIVLEENFGFAGGYNAALEKIDSKYFLLLNSDVEVSEGWLDPMLKMIDSGEDIAAVQPKVLAFNNNTHFEHAGAAGGFMDKDGFPFCRGRLFEVFEEDKGQYNDAVEIFWATGACMLVRADLFKEFGGFDARFFAHMEEIDLCWRWKNAGYKIMAEPASVVYHVGGGSLPYENPRKTFLNFRNSLYMIAKNNRSTPLFFTILKRLILDGIAGLKFMLEGNFKHTWEIIRAHNHFYAHLNTLLRDRKNLAYAEDKANTTGVFQKSIVAARFLGGKKKFSELDQSDFS